MSITVSSLVKYLKNKLDGDDKLQNIQVIGELSNFHKHSSGHLYFTLKDEKSAISCVMFASRANTIKFDPKNGDKVEVSANTSLFEVTGQLQLYVNSMKLQGLGDLFQQYELLKNKLNEEGYFDQEHKKELPCIYPENVCVLVGDKSAAMSDIKTCFLRRWPLANVDYYPVLVQGKEAPKDIIKTLKEVDKLNYQIIILARGGGSFEDLFCFNDEELVKTIYNLKTFIITGIGHEQDFTLADFVSDLRAPTPTACVELTTVNIIDVINELENINENINSSINRKIDNYKMKIDYYSTSINNYSSKLKLISSNIENINKNMKQTINNLFKRKEDELKSKLNLLKAYSVDNTLKRGFSLVYNNDKLISDSKNLKVDSDLSIKLYKGNIKAKVTEA